MALYFISYDLRKERDYDKLYEELRDFNAVRILESQWCFKRANSSSTELRDHFKLFIDNNDGLIVSKVSDWASRNTDNSPNDL